MNERTTAANNRTDGEDDGGEQKQTLERRPAAQDGQQTAPRDTADVDEQPTAASNNGTDSEDSVSERQLAYSIEPCDG